MKKSRIVLCGLALAGGLWAGVARAQILDWVIRPPGASQPFVYPQPSGSYMIRPPRGTLDYLYAEPGGSYLVNPNP